jgi:hypothetical protein
VLDVGGQERRIWFDPTGPEMQQGTPTSDVRQRPPQAADASHQRSRRRFRDEDEVRLQAGHCAEESAIRRDDREVVALDRRHEDEGVIRPGVIGHDEERAACGRTITESRPSRAQVPEHARCGSRQSERIDAPVETRQRSSERDRHHLEGRTDPCAQRRRRASQAKGLHDLLRGVTREGPLQLRRVARVPAQTWPSIR